MTGYNVRRARPGDIPTLLRQRHEMFSEMERHARRALAVQDRAFPGWARREMNGGRLVCFLAEGVGGEVVGGGCVWLREVQPYPGFKGGREPYLMSMYTERGHRGKGVATVIVKHAVAWARKHGYRTISLHASRMGKPVYEKLGWKRTSEMELDLDEGREESVLAVRRRSRRSGR